MRKGLAIGIIAVLIIAIAVGFYMFRGPIALEKSGDSGQGTVAGEGSIVSIKNTKFNPATVNIEAGEKVTWNNEDSIMHSVTIDNGLFNEEIEAEESFTYIFNETGTYDYHCDIHPSMKGRIVVS